MADKNPKKIHYIIIFLLTGARIPLAILFSIVLLGMSRDLPMTEHGPWFFVICAALVIGGEITDFLDGMLARSLNAVTEWGKMLDPYADSISRIIIYWALAVAGLATALVPLAMAFRDVTVAYSRITLTRAGQSVSAKWSGKVKAVVQAVGAVVLLLQPVYWNWGVGRWTIQAGSWIIIVVTMASMFEYTRSAIDAAKKMR